MSRENDIELVRQVEQVITRACPGMAVGEVATALGLARQTWDASRRNGARITTVIGWLERWEAAGLPPITVAQGRGWARAWLVSEAPELPPPG